VSLRIVSSPYLSLLVTVAVALASYVLTGMWLLPVLLSLLLGCAVYLAQAAQIRLQQLQATNALLESEIARRRQMEEELREKQLYTRSLIESSIDALATIDPAGIITDFNQQMTTFTGRPREELIGTSFSNYFREPQRAEEAIRLVLREGTLSNYELTRDSAAGETVVACNASLFHNPEGRVQGIFISARDITERKRSEEQLQRFASELQRSNDELQDFASIASHDLREPLRKITSFGERLRSCCAAQLDATGQDYLLRMENAARRMSLQLEHLLHYSHVSTRARPFEPVDLQATILEVMSDLEARLQESGATVEVLPLPIVEADRLQMRALLQNLVGNAAKFHAPGVVPHIKVEARVDDGWCELQVSDNGVGFDEKHVDSIFRPFHRLHSNGEFEGTGMGLAICRKIVSRHGGTITARSTVGAGSTFIVRLPTRPQPEGSTWARLDGQVPLSSLPKMMTTTTS
jgi:PAS domain S-box-containing protein